MKSRKFGFLSMLVLAGLAASGAAQAQIGTLVFRAAVYSNDYSNARICAAELGDDVYSSLCREVFGTTAELQTQLETMRDRLAVLEASQDEKQHNYLCKASYAFPSAGDGDYAIQSLSNCQLEKR